MVFHEVSPLVFQTGTAENLSLTDSNETNTKLALQSWKPTFLFTETYFQAILDEQSFKSHII